MKPFTIAAVQSSSVKGNIAENVRRHLEFVSLAAEHQCDVVVFPELSLTGYEPSIAAETAHLAGDAAFHPLQKLADTSGIIIIAGCPIRSQDEKPFLGVVIVNPEVPQSVYRKRFVTTNEQQYFIPSSDTVVCTVKTEHVGVAICADISHSAHAADVCRAGATVYAAGVMMTPEDINKADRNMSRYAEQDQMLTVMANYATDTGGYPTAGRSAIWEPGGGLVVRAGSAGEYLAVVSKESSGWTGYIVPADVGVTSE